MTWPTYHVARILQKRKKKQINAPLFCRSHLALSNLRPAAHGSSLTISARHSLVPNLRWRKGEKHTEVVEHRPRSLNRVILALVGHCNGSARMPCLFAYQTSRDHFRLFYSLILMIWWFSRFDLELIGQRVCMYVVWCQAQNFCFWYNQRLAVEPLTNLDPCTPPLHYFPSLIALKLQVGQDCWHLIVRERSPRHSLICM